jgi:general secretion pathway protein D
MRTLWVTRALQRTLLYVSTLALCASCLCAPSAAATSVLESIHTAVAQDGSAVFRLTFSGMRPDSHILRSGERLVHVVLDGTTRAGTVPTQLRDIGPVVRLRVGRFAAVGLRLDFELRRPVKIRTEAEGDVLLVHVPSVKGDEEAAFNESQAQRKAQRAALSPYAIRTVVVRLNFAEVSEVAGLLVKGAVVSSGDNFTAQSPFASPPPSSSSSSSMSSASAASPPTYVSIPTAALLPKDLPQGVRFDEHVAVDRRLNAVILTGTAEQIAEYERIIAEVDRPTASVVLQTQIVELTQTAARDLGVDFSPNGTLATATFGTGTGGRPSAAASFMANLYAEQNNGNAKVLAEPRILSLNGQQAAILSGEAVPIINTITSTSGGSPVLQQQVQYINVGVSLQILPRIAADGRVTAHIFSEVSTIVGEVQNAPQIAVRQELTSAIVTDGDALVIGGLLQENDITSLRKIPGLGDLPILGKLFQYGTSSSQKTNLYIVITPHVISNRIVPPTIKPLTPH